MMHGRRAGLSCVLVLAGCAAQTGSGAPDLAAGGTPDSGAMSDGASSDASAGLPPLNLASAAIYSVFPTIYSQSGNLAAVTADLPRIHQLGFNVLYLLPVTPLGQQTGNHPAFGSPYCVHDYRAINPALGSDQDLLALVHAAHGLGMYVVLDEVLNHTAWDNPLITQRPEYYLHNDGNPHNVNSIVQAFNFSDVAQLDYKTPANGLANFMTDMLTYWIRTFDIDGFRFDTADDPPGMSRMIPASFWQALRPQLETVKSGILMLGEEEDIELARAPFELDYGWQLQGALAMVAKGADANLLRQAWQSQKSGWPAGMLHVTLLQDWDLDEDLKVYGGVANTLAAACFVFTSDGVPLLFNGEEVGNDNSGINTQAPINWNGPNAASFTAFYQSLLALRMTNPALQQGSLVWVDNDAATKVVSYARSDGSSTFLVTINLSNTPITGNVSAPGAGWTDVSPARSPGGNAHALPPALSLAPYDFAVFRAH